MSDEPKTIPAAGRLKRRTRPVSEQPITDEERAELDDPRLAKPKTTARLGMSIAAAPTAAVLAPQPAHKQEAVGLGASPSLNDGRGATETRLAPRRAGKTDDTLEGVGDVKASQPKRGRGAKSPAGLSAESGSEKTYRRVGFSLNASARQKLVEESDGYGSNVAAVIAKVIDAHESGRIDEIYARYLPSSKSSAQVAALLPSAIRLPRQSQAGKPRLQIKLLESTLEALEEMLGRPELSFASRLTAIVEDAYDESAMPIS